MSQILLVASDAVQAEPLERSLSSHGHRVSWVTDAGGALAAWRGARPDGVVLVDPVLGGGALSLCARLRLETLGPPVPVILLSVRPDGAERARQSGARAFLPLPVEDGELVALVRALLEPVPAPPAVLWGFGEATAPPVDREEPFDPTRLPSLLLEAHKERWTARLHFLLAGGEAVLDLHRGHPSAMTCSWPVDLPPPPLRRDLAERAPMGSPIHPVALLVKEGWMGEAERWDQEGEALIRRVLSLVHNGRGRVRVEPLPLLQEPGCPVPLSALLWRMEDALLAGAAAPFLPPGSEGAFLLPAPTFDDTWRWLDPDGRSPGLRLLLVGGVRVQDVMELAGAAFRPRIGVLVATGVLSLSEEAPQADQRSLSLSQASPQGWQSQLQQRVAARADADPWTVLGLAPGASVAQVEQAAALLLEEYHPHALPLGITGADREAARRLRAQALRALRILGDPELAACAARLLCAPDGPWVPEWDEQTLWIVDRARRYLRGGNPLAAASLLALALELEGEDPDVLALLGVARRGAAPDDPTAGESCLRRALALDPDNALALEALLTCPSAASIAPTLARRLLASDPTHAAARRALHGGLP